MNKKPEIMKRLPHFIDKPKMETEKKHQITLEDLELYALAEFVDAIKEGKISVAVRWDPISKAAVIVIPEGDEIILSESLLRTLKEKEK